MFAGASEIVLTLPVGIPLMVRPSIGVHDELFARALVISDGQKRVAMVCLDLIGLNFATTDSIRARVQEAIGEITVLLNFSHSHSAPMTLPYTVLAQDWLCGSGRWWMNELVGKITQVICEADANLSEAILSAGRADVRIGENRTRQFYEAAGIEPPGEQAEVSWVDVLRVDGTDGKPIAIQFSHAAHPINVHHASDCISADYPGYAVRTVREHFGSEVVAMFAQGCGADIDAIPVNAGFEAAEAAGTALGKAVIAAANDCVRLDSQNLAVFSTTIGLPFLDYPSREKLEAEIGLAQERFEALGKNPEEDLDAWWGLDTVLCFQDILEKMERNEKAELRFEINGVALGSAFCLLAMPHEMFHHYQLWANEISKFDRTMVWGYTNACESYIPVDLYLKTRGPEVAGFPDSGAPVRYRNRLKLRSGLEPMIKKAIQDVLSGLMMEAE